MSYYAVTILVAITSMSVLVAGLKYWKRPFIATDGTVFLVVNAVWQPPASQHLFDLFSIQHFQHGLVNGILGSFLPWLWIQPHPEVLLSASLVLAVLWELLENNSVGIAYIQTQPLTRLYTGDTTVNALIDCLCCVGGTAVVLLVGSITTTLLVLLGLEVCLIVIGRDSIGLQILQMLCPLPGIVQWQLGYLHGQKVRGWGRLYPWGGFVRSLLSPIEIENPPEDPALLDETQSIVCRLCETR